MSFSDHCDVFGAVHEDGFNLVVGHLMGQRPSLFNYATQALADDPRYLCEKVEAVQEVTELVDVVEPIPIIGAAVPISLNWCLQFRRVAIDFHPGNAIGLPPELGALPEQRFALELQACAGIQCLGRNVIVDLLPGIEVAAVAKKQRADDRRDPKDPIVLPVRDRDMRCFCLGVYAIGHFEWGTIGSATRQWLKVRLDGLEIVDIQPRGLEDAIECYVADVLHLGLLPRLSTPIEKIVLDITKLLRQAGLTIGHQVSLVPTPVSATLAHNPAIEEDQLKAFTNLVITPPL